MTTTKIRADEAKVGDTVTSDPYTRRRDRRRQTGLGMRLEVTAVEHRDLNGATIVVLTGINLAPRQHAYAAGEILEVIR